MLELVLTIIGGAIASVVGSELWKWSRERRRRKTSSDTASDTTPESGTERVAVEASAFTQEREDASNGSAARKDVVVSIEDQGKESRALERDRVDRLDEEATERKADLFHKGREIIASLEDPFYDWESGQKTPLDRFWDGVDEFVQWRERLCRFLRDDVEGGQDLIGFVNARLKDVPLTRIVIARGRYPDVGGKHATTMTDREVVIPRPEDVAAAGWETGRYYITDTQGKRAIREYKAALERNLDKIATKLDEHLAEHGFKVQGALTSDGRESGDRHRDAVAKKDALRECSPKTS